MMQINKIPSIWLYRGVRWFFGLLFIGIGISFKDGWPAIIFGAIFIVTSFFKPHRCIDTSCTINPQTSKTK